MNTDNDHGPVSPSGQPIVYDPKGSRGARLRSLWQIMRCRASQGHVSTARQLMEMAVLWVRNGIRPPYYLSAGLYRSELAWRDKLAHIDRRTYEALAGQINPEHYLHLTAHKLASQGLLEMFDIPMPRFFGYVNPKYGYAFDGRPLRSLNDVGDLLRRIDTDRVCFKMLSGSHGRGLLVAKVEPDASAVVLHPNSERVTLEELWDKYLQTQHQLGYFCQEAIDQHPDIARFAPLSVNTVRAWMYQPEEGVWELLGAAWRMGDGESITDSIIRGGVAPRIDPATGVLRPAIMRRPERYIRAKHPVTGVQLEGVPAPMWKEIYELCERTAGVFPFLGMIALDVALSRRGPLITEVNGRPDDHQVGFDRGFGPFMRALARGDGAAARREANRPLPKSPS